MNIEEGKSILKEENLTCIIFNNEYVYKSSKRGVKPLLELLDGKDKDKFKGAVAVDKVVGKAAAFLYEILQIKELHVGVISKRAVEVLESNNIKVSYEELVPYIINRTKDGRCPMETAVWDIDDCSIALEKIRETVAKLSK